MSANLHPIFREILAAHIDMRPRTTNAPFETTCPQAIASVALMHEAMDETMTAAVRVPLTYDDIEALTDGADMAASTEDLEDVKHDMRTEWERARFWLGGLNPPTLPVVVDGNIVMLSFPQVLALCGETNHLYVMLAHMFRGASPAALHAYLRDAWIEGFAGELAAIGWRA